MISAVDCFIEVVCMKSSTGAMLSPDGKHLAVSNLLSSFFIYHVLTGVLVKHLLSSGAPADNTDCPVLVYYLNGGEFIIGGSCTGRIRLWNTTMWKKVQTLSHEGMCLMLWAICQCNNYKDHYRPYTSLGSESWH